VFGMQNSKSWLIALLAGSALGVILAACGASARTDSARVDAAARASGLRLARIGVFAQPTYATGAPGDNHRLFVAEKRGVIVVIVNGHRRARPFLDISNLVKSSDSEQGLLSIAFAPDYRRSGRFYVYYTGAGNNVHIAGYRRAANDPDRADSGSAANVLTIDHHSYTNHNGGQLAFGPDHYLYVGVGDGGNEGDPLNRGQNTGVLLGKLLRIAPRPSGGYSIPRGNPFVGRPGRRPEIWASGLRNPWRFSFDRRTSALVIGDVGQDQQEEVDFARRGRSAGANYGWSIFEGYRREKPGTAPGAVRPAFVTLHSAGNCAIIGGYFVRTRTLPSLAGQYLYADLCKPQIRSVKLSPGRARGNRSTGLSVSNMSSFGEDTLGRIYAVSLDGPVYRLAQR
jgi:glucose/arabinose dehydrogenase